MSITHYPQLLFPEGFDERAAFEMTLKGWITLRVQTDEKTRYEVTFIDPVRLKQDLEAAIEQGEPCMAEPALIVLPDVTLTAIQRSIVFLYQHDFFSRLKPED